MNNWTKKEEQYLKDNWLGGLTSREIAGNLGKTKNAVIGKAQRLKLGNKKKKGLQGNGTRRAPVMRKSSIMNGLAPYKRSSPIIKGREREEIDQTAYGEPKPLIDVKENMCRWPVGDKYCCAKVERGSYCRKHADISYV